MRYISEAPACCCSWRDWRDKLMTERKRLTKKERQTVFDKMKGHCAYCGCEISLDEMQVDHIMPLRKGGLDELENMLPACRSCNHYKSTLTVQQFRETVERMPYRLERDNATFRNAVRFGLVVSNPNDVTFFFELKAAKDYDTITRVRARLVELMEGAQE